MSERLRNVGITENTIFSILSVYLSLPLFALPRDGDTSNSTIPQSPPLWVIFLGRDSVEAQTRYVSSSASASDCTTTVW